MDIKILEACPLFIDLSSEELKEILSESDVFLFEPGDLVLNKEETKKSDEEKNFLILVHGQASVINYLDDNTEVELQKMQIADIFGEIVFFQSVSPNVNIKCHVETHFLQIKLDKIYSLFKKNPQVLSIVFNNLIQLLLLKQSQAEGIIYRLLRDENIKIRMPIYQGKRNQVFSNEDRNKFKANTGRLKS